ncbi:MAG TPA: glycoside hydrolase family 3 N-terminal domain-containing protein [Anaerolineales bacterium]|nr:glycoside hydrolase family 3 N-terminal domain-containing protein [Anaerolineales bacterium]
MTRRSQTLLLAWRRTLPVALILVLAIPALGATPYQGTTPQDQAARLLESLSPQERVGQLFIVTFQGQDVGPTSTIYELISEYHIGGVLLRTSNGNILPGAGEASGLNGLTNALQQAGASAVRAAAEPGDADTSAASTFVPLLVALAQSGDGYPGSNLANDVTLLPSQMAIGATWDSALAEAAGFVAGRELAALGVNLLLGPSLDVVERPNPVAAGDLGSGVFGGDPFWVGNLGAAFIRGVHRGGVGRVAVVPTHFPGIGGSDRDPEEEVATVRKALEQLRQIDLAPFAAVTRGELGDAGTADGLLVSHIRYQGLQGNIRVTTRPLSLDPQALAQVMGLPEFSSWRESGGLTVSDSLGSQSVRRFYDPSGVAFAGRLLAKDAFLAGNDLLLLADFRSSGVGDERLSIEETIASFVQKYQEDAAFAQRVDESVVRILALKYRLYPFFDSLSSTTYPGSRIEVGQDAAVAFEIESRGLTRLSPASAEVDERGLEPPTTGDRILFLTDSRSYRPCTACDSVALVPYDVLRKVVERMYGPQGSGQISAARLTSYSFADLATYLQGSPNENLARDLDSATIIVALTLNTDPAVAGSHALSDLLSQRADLVRRRKVIVFALGAPYYLDSTDISKITAYYALYSKVPAAIEVAARTLFGELAPQGASPVAVEGVGYSLVTALSAAPNQIIPLAVESVDTGPGTPAPTPSGYRVGDSLHLKAGPVIDQNGHLVPDGTVVRFRIAYPAENIPTLVLEGATQAGLATASHVIDRIGAMEVYAVSEPAMVSTILLLQVGETPGFVTAIAPTPPPTATLGAGVSEATPALVPVEGDGASEGPAGGTALAASLLVLGGLGALVGFMLGRLGARGWEVRGGLAVVVGGLLAYDYLAMNLPGTESVTSGAGPFGGVIVALVGGLVGGAAVWALARWRRARN